MIDSVVLEYLAKVPKLSIMLTLDDDFLAIFLVFYRKFAAPSTLLHGLIAKFEEASRSAIDYMLQMIIQTRYLIAESV